MTRYEHIQSLYSATTSDSVFFAFMRMVRMPVLREFYQHASTLQSGDNGDELSKRLIMSRAALDSFWAKVMTNDKLVSMFGISFQSLFVAGEEFAVIEIIKTCKQLSPDFGKWLVANKVLDQASGITSEVIDFFGPEKSKLRKLIVEYNRHFIEPYLSKEALSNFAEANKIVWSKLSGEHESIFFDFCDVLCWKSNDLILKQLAIDRNSYILDIGSGSGLLLDQLRARGYSKLESIDCRSREFARNKSKTYIQSFLDENAISVLAEKKKYGAIFLSWILHDWNDESAIKVLKNAKRLLEPNGRIYVLEQIQPDGQVRINSTLDALVYLHTRGQERSLKEYVYLANCAGLKLERSIINQGNRDLMVLEV